MSTMPTLKLSSLLKDNKEVFFKELENVIAPTFTGLKEPEKYRPAVELMDRGMMIDPFGSQQRLIAAGSEALETRKSIILSSEMGTGKTLMSLGIALKAKSKVNFIVSPPHLVSKWAEEIRKVYRPSEVNYKIVIVTRWEDLVPYTDRDLRKEGCKYFFIVSRETAKLSYKRVHAFNTKSKYIWKEKLLDGETLEYKVKVSTPVCPKCGNPLEEEEQEGKKKKPFPYKCSHKEHDAEGNVIEGSECGEVLRDVDRSVSYRMRTRISVAEYLKKQWKKGSIDLLIVDEIHEYKGGDTGQGNAMAMMVTRARKIVGLTGTLMNGYASSLFYILYRLNPHMMKNRLNLDYNQVKQFVEIYGAHEEVVEAVETNHEGIVTRMGKRIALKEKPKISPYLLSLILDMTIFLRLDEIKMEEGAGLPPYEESIRLVEMNKEFKKQYDGYIGSIAAAIRKDKRFLGNLAMDSLSVPDLPYSHHSAHSRIFYKPMVIRSEGDRTFEEQVVLPYTNKELELVKLVKEEIKEGRKCLVYVHFSNKGVGDDVERILQEALPGKVVKLLKPTVPANKRQEWIRNNPCDVLICNPELVKTGLDLLEYPTIIYYETGYNIFTLKQASRRSWRIGQTNPVKVIFMAYKYSAQHIALKLIGAKVNAANSLEGRLSGEDDLSSLGEDDDNIQLALAKAILNGDKAEGDIEMTSIKSQGEREWDAFEAYYRERKSAYITYEPEEKPEAKEVETKITDAIGLMPKAEEVAVETEAADELFSAQMGFSFFDDENEDGNIGDKIVVYKRVRKGRRYVEMRMEMTKGDIDEQVNAAISDDDSSSIQLSLF